VNSEAEQLLLLAARLQVTWHYARLLSASEHRRGALIERNLGPESTEEVKAIQDEIAGLEGYLVQVRCDARAVGVIGSELERVLGVLERERRLVATMVARELRAPAPPGSYAHHDHRSWGVPGEGLAE
jgi:hypothetical protein